MTEKRPPHPKNHVLVGCACSAAQRLKSPRISIPDRPEDKQILVRDDRARESSGARLASLVEREEGRPGDELVPPERCKQRDVPLEEDEACVLADAGESTGEVDQPALLPPRPDRHSD